MNYIELSQTIKISVLSIRFEIKITKTIKKSIFTSQ